MIIGEGVWGYVLDFIHLAFHVILCFDFVGVFFHFEDLEAVGSDGLLEFGDLDFAVVEEAFGVFVFEMEVEGGVAEVDLTAVALVAGGLSACAGLAPPSFFHLRVVVIGFR